MTKKLTWRLGKLPTPEEVSKLVNDKIITHEEARQILFSETDETERDVNSLKEEIKFLRELVEKLSNKTQITETIKEVYTPYYRYNWYKQYDSWKDSIVLCSSNTQSSPFNDIKTF